jgi:hypothetical protein
MGVGEDTDACHGLSKIRIWGFRQCSFLLVQKRTKKGHHGDHPESGLVAQVIPTWPSTFGIALTVDLQPHGIKQESAADRVQGA